MSVVDSFSETIKRYNLIKPGDLILVGVSGGPDSLTLLHLLWSHRSVFQYDLHVAHLDHSLRGKEAEVDALWVEKTAHQWGIPCTRAKIDVAARARREGLSLQEAGHVVRREFFLELLEQLGAQKVALGHHADDQAETMFLHFIKGTGLEGLQGIRPLNGPFIRPLLFIRRAEIEAYCREHELNPRWDPSNEKDVYLRNKIRHHLLPWVKENVNSNLVETLSRTALIIQAEEDYLEEKTKEALKRCSDSGPSGVRRISLLDFRRYERNIRRRVIRSCYRDLGCRQGLPFEHVERVDSLALEGETGKLLHLPGRVTVEKTYDHLLFYRTPVEKPPVEKLKKRPLLIPGNTPLPELDQVVQITVANKSRLSEEKDVVYLPLEGDFPRLYARTRMEGDRISLPGLKGRKRIKDYLMEKKIPRDKRDQILFIADEKEVLWIPGLAVSRRLKARSTSGKYLEIKIVPAGKNSSKM